MGGCRLRTVTGKTKRVRVYAATHEGARRKLTALLTSSDKHIPAPDVAWTVGRYLDFWLTSVAPQRVRPTTLALYEMIVRTRLKPGLGTKSLTRLSVQAVQTYLNDLIAGGLSVRSTRLTRAVLSAALTRAMREELVHRNVARLVELPPDAREPITPWTAHQAATFIRAAQSHRLTPAFVLAAVYGLRRGEVLGLQWEDVDLEGGVLHVRQQLQRIRGELELTPLKSSAGRRDFR